MWVKNKDLKRNRRNEHNTPGVLTPRKTGNNNRGKRIDKPADKTTPNKTKMEKERKKSCKNQ